jgi:hypothetical protein
MRPGMVVPPWLTPLDGEQGPADDILREPDV